MAGASNWEALIATADVAGADNPLWLDPHRYISLAMDNLGEAYFAAKQALLVEVALLLQRAPELPTLTFNDGSPFADADTVAWIEAEVSKVLGSGGGGAPAGPRSVLDKPLGISAPKIKIPAVL